MLDRAKAGAFAYPAINVSSSQTIIAAIRGFAEAESDGIIQFSWGGAEYASGSTVKNMVDGAVALAEFAHVVAKNYNVNIAIHTDHCPAEKLDGYMRPLLEIGAQRIKDGKAPLFNSHMWDGSAVDMPENMKVAKELLAKSVAARTILEIEKKMALRQSTMQSCTQLQRMHFLHLRLLETIQLLATWLQQPSETFTVSTSQETSSCSQRFCRHFRMQSQQSSALLQVASQWISSSTVALVHYFQRSANHLIMVLSR
jgi:hypothetical protein